MAVNLGLYDDEIENRNGQGLKLAFVYDDVPYYFSPDVWTDEDSTGYQPRGKEPILGIEANQQLMDAITRYGESGGETWIAPWFRSHVSMFLSEKKGR